MDALYLLQYTCFIVMIILELALALSCFQQNTTRHYQQSRLLIMASIFLLACHYFLQMEFDLRADNDDIGMVFNLLFYTPVAFLISDSIIRMESDDRRFRRYSILGSISSVLVILAFAVGWLSYDSLKMPFAQYAMHAIFAISMMYFIITPLCEIHRNHKRIIDNTGGDILPYARYTWSSYILLSTISFTLIFAIIWRPMLFVIGPILLLSLFIFTFSFIALGYNITTIDDTIMDELSKTECGQVTAPTVATPSSDTMDTCLEDESETTGITSELVERIDAKLNEWIGKGGYRDSTINLSKLSQQLSFPRRNLSYYFENVLHSTFRTWLSDIRLNEAKRLIKLHPEYNNDTISSCCGFSSRSQLYKIFSDRIGMSPREWYEQSVVSI